MRTTPNRLRSATGRSRRDPWLCVPVSRRVCPQRRLLGIGFGRVLAGLNTRRPELDKRRGWVTHGARYEDLARICHRGNARTNVDGQIAR
jgi:hypothetical protein